MKRPDLFELDIKYENVLEETSDDLAGDRSIHQRLSLMIDEHPSLSVRVTFLIHHSPLCLACGSTFAKCCVKI